MNTADPVALAAHADDPVSPAPGSDFYYASLYFAPAVRYEIQVLEALRREIGRIPETCSDRGVAHIKLAWWREELTRLGPASPRHQLARALGNLLERRPDLSNRYLNFIDAVDASLLEPEFASDAAIDTALEAAQGEIIDAIADSEQPCAAHERVVMRRLATLIERAYALRNLRQHRRAGPLLLARDRLQRHGLSVEQVRYATSSGELLAMLREALGTLRDDMTRELATMPRSLRRRQRLLTTLARIQAHALQLTLDGGCAVMERRIELTPVHKLFIAWRTCRFG